MGRGRGEREGKGVGWGGRVTRQESGDIRLGGLSL